MDQSQCSKIPGLRGAVHRIFLKFSLILLTFLIAGIMEQRAEWTLKCGQTQYMYSSLSVINFHACLYLVLVRIFNYYKSLETASWAYYSGLGRLAWCWSALVGCGAAGIWALMVLGLLGSSCLVIAAMSCHGVRLACYMFYLCLVPTQCDQGCSDLVPSYYWAKPRTVLSLKNGRERLSDRIIHLDNVHPIQESFIVENDEV